jgi:biopolymer transport protein ExbD
MSLFNKPNAWEGAKLEASGIPRRRIVDTDEEMDITPMIDITFLLLIFFLVASKIDAGSEVTLPLAKNGTAVTIKNASVLSMYGGTPAFTDVYIGEGDNKQKINAADPIVQEELIVGFIEQAAQAQPPKTQVILRADKGTKHREVARVLRALGQVEGVSAYVAVLEDQ